MQTPRFRPTPLLRQPSGFRSRLSVGPPGGEGRDRRPDCVTKGRGGARGLGAAQSQAALAVRRGSGGGLALVRGGRPSGPGVARLVAPDPPPPSGPDPCPSGACPTSPGGAFFTPRPTPPSLLPFLCPSVSVCSTHSVGNFPASACFATAHARAGARVHGRCSAGQGRVRRGRPTRAAVRAWVPPGGRREGDHEGPDRSPSATVVPVLVPPVATGPAGPSRVLVRSWGDSAPFPHRRARLLGAALVTPTEGEVSVLYFSPDKKGKVRETEGGGVRWYSVGITGRTSPGSGLCDSQGLFLRVPGSTFLPSEGVEVVLRYPPS